MSVAASAVSAYSSGSVVESSKRVALRGLTAMEPPLRSRVKRVMNRITAGIERVSELVGESSSVNDVWFRRGIEQSNFAYFEASLLPVKSQLQQAAEAYLESADVEDATLRQQIVARAARLMGCRPDDLGARAGMMLVVDECLHQAFKNRDQWLASDEDPLKWVAGFIPSAVAEFVGAA